MNRHVAEEPGSPSREQARGEEAKTRDPGEITTARLYRVQEGDDLHSIARRFFGSSDLWVFLYAANQQIRGIRGVVPGQVLYIPEIEGLDREPGAQRAHGRAR